MSFKAFVWAWEQETANASELLVLLTLADIAGESGHVFASAAYIAKKCQRSERHVRSVLFDLENRFISSKERPGRTDLITLLIPREFLVRMDGYLLDGDLESGKRGRPRKRPAPDAEKVGISLQKGVTPLADEPSTEPEDEPKDVILRTPEPFEAWWAIYPRKAAKKEARKAWAQMTGEIAKLTLAELMIRTSAFAESVVHKDPEHIAHPATWLRGERWNDELPNRSQTDEQPPRTASLDRGADQHSARVETMVDGARQALDRRRRWTLGG